MPGPEPPRLFFCGTNGTAQSRARQAEHHFQIERASQDCRSLLKRRIPKGCRFESYLGSQISKLHAGFEPCETRWPWAGAGSTPASSGPSAEPGVDQALGNGVIRHCPRPFPSGPPPRPQTRLDVAQTLAVSQLREGHRQVLVPARETSPVSITAITGHPLLKLVGGQVVHELSKNGLAGIHPSLSAIGQGARRGGFSPARLRKVQIEKSNPPPTAPIQQQLSTLEKL